MRLIDADLLLKEIEENYDLNYGEILINPNNFYDIVEQQPTISKMETTTWIPCSERLPEVSGDYLCYEEYEQNKFDIFIEEIDCDGIFKQWNITNSERIIAWQPLPQPYKGDLS